MFSISKNKIILILSIFNAFCLNNYKLQAVQLTWLNSSQNGSASVPVLLSNGTQLGPSNGLISYNNGTNQSNYNILNTNQQLNNNSLIYGINNNTINQQHSQTNNRKIYNKAKTKSCQNEYSQSNGSYILDLSDTYDVNTNTGIEAVNKFIENAENKKYDCVYIDLCNTDVDQRLVQYWNKLLKQKNIQVLWNLSNNSTIDDNIFSYLEDLDNIKGLNISNTNVTSNGIAQYLYPLLGNNTNSTIQFINICGLNINKSLKHYLESAFLNHIKLWQQQNSNKEYICLSNPIIDNYENTNNYLVTTGINNNNTQIVNTSNSQNQNLIQLLQQIFNQQNNSNNQNLSQQSPISLQQFLTSQNSQLNNQSKIQTLQQLLNPQNNQLNNQTSTLSLQQQHNFQNNQSLLPTIQQLITPQSQSNSQNLSTQFLQNSQSNNQPLSQQSSQNNQLSNQNIIQSIQQILNSANSQNQLTNNNTVQQSSNQFSNMQNQFAS